MKKKIKKKTYLRFNAKPQPGYLLGFYSVPRKEILNSPLFFFQYEYDAAIQGDWDKVKSQDLILASVNIKEPIVLETASREMSGFPDWAGQRVSPPKHYITPSHPLFENENTFHGDRELFYYVYVNDKKEIIYRYTTGRTSVFNPGTDPIDVREREWAGTGNASFYNWNGGLCFAIATRKFLWPVYIDSNGNSQDVPTSEMTKIGEGVVRFEEGLYEKSSDIFIEIKEKKIIIDNITKEAKEEILPDVYSFSWRNRELSRKGEYVYPSVGGFPGGRILDTDYAVVYPSYSGVESSWWLSHHGSIFVNFFDENFGSEPFLDLDNNPMPPAPSPLPLGVESMTTTIDKYGEYSVYMPGSDIVKVDTLIPPVTIPPQYVRNPQFAYMEASVYFGTNYINDLFLIPENCLLKCADRDLILIDKFDKSVIWKDGQEYVLPTSYSYQINGITISLPFMTPKKTHLYNYVSEQVEEHPTRDVALFANYFSSFAMVTWFVDANQFTEESSYWNTSIEDYTHFMTSSWFGDYIYKVRVDELKDGSFFYDRLIKSNFNYDLITQMAEEENLVIKQDLKIYMKETTSLWVEKYQVILKEDLTAEIQYVSRFKTSFTPPYQEEADDVIRLLECYSLKQIIFVPFN
jgi:hypothetical protein